MNRKSVLRLEALRSDFESLTGIRLPFLCPILLQDDDVELLQAHIINEAFPNTSRRQTVQRRDVDNFYGTYFESEFVRMQHQGVRVEQAASDPKLRKQFPLDSPRRSSLPHFESKGEVPAGFTRINVLGSDDDKPLSLVLKITPEECVAAAEEAAKIKIERDLRLPSLVSLLKSAAPCLLTQA